MKIVIGFLVVLSAYFCGCDNQGCKNCAEKKAELSLEELRQLRYALLKNQILRKLQLTEAPKTNLPKPPLKSLLAIAEMAANETGLETDDQPKTESVIIYPQNGSHTCFANESHPCHRFEFVVPDSLQLEYFLSAEIWFHKSETNSFRVFQIITDSLRNATVSFELDEKLEREKNVKSCIKYNIRANLTTENLLEFEVLNYVNDTNSGIEEKPFLVIRSEKAQVSRRRRSFNCPEYSSSCCKENFFLNFSEIGWDNWILHPDGYQANFCRGRCFNDLSNTRFYHSTVLLSYIRDNKDIAEEIGLNMCCTPSVMAPVTIIYRNEEGLIYHKSIENMKVEACDCA